MSAWTRTHNFQHTYQVFHPSESFPPHRSLLCLSNLCFFWLDEGFFFFISLNYVLYQFMSKKTHNPLHVRKLFLPSELSGLRRFANVYQHYDFQLWVNCRPKRVQRDSISHPSAHLESVLTFWAMRATHTCFGLWLQINWCLKRDWTHNLLRTWLVFLLSELLGLYRLY